MYLVVNLSHETPVSVERDRDTALALSTALEARTGHLYGVQPYTNGGK